MVYPNAQSEHKIRTTNLTTYQQKASTYQTIRANRQARLVFDPVTG
ncbi:MAG TPA: hypothetical protein VNZ49_03100 [Bacteroidia bacterium]|nr:hypothetical protein [Bacteroidia bacterium]